jgi:AcrR family transcriptional regulator
MPNKTALPAHQERSRESLERLLRATVEILDKHGIEGATIPRIAARAGLSPGAVYRRFPDKDALLREVCLRLLEANYQQTRELFATERWKDKSLAEMGYAMIDFVLDRNRTNRGLVRAMLIFTLQHPDAAFVRKSAVMREKTFQVVTELLLTRRGEIHHHDPESVVNFAMLMVRIAAQGVLVLPQALSRPVPGVENQLERELPRMFLRYLGIED